LSSIEALEGRVVTSTWMSWGQAWAAAAGALVIFRMLVWAATAWLVARPAKPAQNSSSPPPPAEKKPAVAAAGAPFSLFQGQDGRWSTSKTSALLWTYAIVWAFLAILFRTGGGDNFPMDELQPEYLIVMGIPVGSALLAKGITTKNVASGKVTTKSPAQPANFDPAKGLAQLVGNDKGDLDLLDFQYFAFNCVLLAFFFVTFFRLEAPLLPNLPDSLFALSGVSAAAYVAKKTQEGDADPTILTIVPPAAARGDSIQINGATFADEVGGKVDVVIGKAAVSATVAQTAANESVTVVVPVGAPLGATTLYVVNGHGKATTAHAFEVLAAASQDGDA
jgi:hypothetical protein